MRLLTDDLTDDPHNTNYDYSFYTEVKRKCPFGETVVIEVEAFVEWDGTPKPEVKYFSRIGSLQKIGNGLAIHPDSFLMLSDAEIQDLELGPEVDDYYKEGLIADDHEKDVERYHETTR